MVDINKLYEKVNMFVGDKFENLDSVLNDKERELIGIIFSNPYDIEVVDELDIFNLPIIEVDKTDEDIRIYI